MVEILRKSLNEELDPEEVVEQHQMLGDKYHAEAFEGNLVQVSEKDSDASAINGGSENLALNQHGSMWNFVSKISKDSGALSHFYRCLHRNFYER